MDAQIEAVLDFLRKSGFSQSAFALQEDFSQRKESFDFEKFLFPMNPPLPPVKVQATKRRVVGSGSNSGSGSGRNSSGDEEFKSMSSSISTSVSGVCSYSADFTNPYGRGHAMQASSDSSSDRLSQFGTAREYHDFDMQNDSWYDEKDEGPYMTPSFGGLEPFGCPSEDKFVMTSETGNSSRNPFSFNHVSEESEENDRHLEYPFQSHRSSADSVDHDQVKECYHVDEKVHPEEGVNDSKDLGSRLKVNIMSELESKLAKKQVSDDPIKENRRGSATEVDNTPKTNEASEANFLLDNGYNSEYGVGGDMDVVKSSEEPTNAVKEQEGTTTPDEIPFWETNEDDYEVFNLRIVHRKNRTGFEQCKDFPIVLNSMVAGRYYVTEYLGSAAFSKVVQAHDIQTGVDVCLKIINNDKDFFDQSLDEIKLLKYINKHDPADEHHLIRLYDYFYHQEHLFIVCELLRANLYEFQKYNLESGGEPYFSMCRLQAIARQCLEALDYLHGLGIIHCDLKPENVLIKNYSRCEIKVIDLGSSCFKTDNLCLYVQSRSYRAPEVFLGLPYDPKIDIWSLGCIMAELCSGEVLFPNEGVVMLLARMIGLLGPIDLEMLLRGQETHKYFTQEYDLFHINEDTNEAEYIIPEQSSLEQHLPVFDDGFIDFLKYLLQINPRKRPTARHALEHPWLSYPY